jgi:hypothetical protein
MLVNRSEPYAGALVVVAVPKGSQWKITLSDVPNPRTADTDLGPSDRMAALERNMMRRTWRSAAGLGAASLGDVGIRIPWSG